MMFRDIGAVGAACENATVKFGNAPSLERFKSEIASPLGECSERYGLFTTPITTPLATIATSGAAKAPVISYSYYPSEHVLN